MKQFLLGILLLPFTAWASNCYEATILEPSPFMGNNDEIFKLSDGSIWQVKYEYEYLYEYFPDVVICPDDNRLLIDGKSLNVMPAGMPRIPSSQGQQADSPAESGYEDRRKLIESQIDGDFEGWEGETIVRLMDGSIWQQSEYHYEYMYAFMPEVLVYQSGSGYKMQIEGISRPIGVIQLR